MKTQKAVLIDQVLYALDIAIGYDDNVVIPESLTIFVNGLEIEITTNCRIDIKHRDGKNELARM